MVVRYLLAILSFLNCETVRLLVIQDVIDMQLHGIEGGIGMGGEVVVEPWLALWAVLCQGWLRPWLGGGAWDTAEVNSQECFVRIFLIK